MGEREYIIAWVSRHTGAEGKGTAQFTRDEADRIAAQLNAQCPELLHWAVRVPVPAEARRD